MTTNRVDQATREKMMLALIAIVVIVDLFMALVFFALFRFAMNLDLPLALALGFLAGGLVAALAFLRFRGLMKSPKFRMAHAGDDAPASQKGPQ